MAGLLARARLVVGNLLPPFGYLAAALVFNWPLPLHLSTHLTGPIGGDTGAYVWNLWLFRHELVAHGRFPLFTHEILSLTPQVDLSLHNYTLFADVLAFPLIPVLGVTASFNLVYIAMPALSAWAMFILARRVIGRVGEAWLAGLLFGFSPFMMARGTEHFSLVTAAPLPIFVLCLVWLDRAPGWRAAAAMGLTMAWAAICDPYYAIFCVLIAACYVGAQHVEMRLQARPPELSASRIHVLDAFIVFLLILIVAIAVTGGGRVRVLTHDIAMQTLYTPVLALVALLGLRTYLVYHPRIVVTNWLPSATVLRIVLIALAAFLVPLAPVLYAFSYRLADGGSLHAPIYWRSSPQGVDLLAFFMPNPNLPDVGRLWRRWLALRPNGFVENVASLTYVGLLTTVVASWRYGFRPRRVWLVLALCFGALALGPFVFVGGWNTTVPGPWALLRYVPGIGAARMPSRFTAVFMLGFALIFGLALAHIADHHRRRRGLLLAVVTCLLAVELAPYPRRLYSAEVPAIYQIIANDPRDVRVLGLPFGIRDGERSLGDFSAASQYYQTFHQKRIIGGYLSRVTDREVERQRRFLIVRTLVRLSQGETVEGLETRRASGPEFVKQARIGYVVMETERVTPTLRQFAIDAFQLKKIAESGGRELFVPAAPAP